MSSSELVLETPHLLDPLREIEPRLSEIGRAELAQLLGPLIARLHEALRPVERDEFSGYGIALCRRLYSNARSGDALPLGRAMLFQACLSGDGALERRASTVCGLLAADVGDVVQAVEHYADALRLAGDDAVEASGIWNNIGLAMGIAGNHEMAARCYQRAIHLLENLPQSIYARYAARVNLAQSDVEIGAFEDGLAAGEKARAEETAQLRKDNPMGVLRLRRNLVRLLVAVGRTCEAEPHVHEAARLAHEVGTPRAAIAAALARSAFELADRRSDIALTRLEGALTMAREVPAALGDTLSCMVRAQEQVGNTELALLHLTELSDRVYRSAIERARQHVELATLGGYPQAEFDHGRRQARARLISKVRPPEQPEGWAALDRLAVTAVMRVDKTGWHGKRVGALAKALALASGIDPLQSIEIGFAAEVHDIGMLSVPEEILGKKTPLSEAERAIMQRHIDAGSEILRDDRHPRIFLAREIARYHHARWDGEGYPQRVGGRFIPLAARICAIADAYDEMVSGLGAPCAKTMGEALSELKREAGTRFDPELVACFDRLVREESEDLGVDLASASGMEGFQELVNALQEDRGFV